MSIDTVSNARPSLSHAVAVEIKVSMVRKGISGRQLAQRLGVSQTWVSIRLTGTTPIDLNDLQRIADALGVKVVDLLPDARPTGGWVTPAARPRGCRHPGRPNVPHALTRPQRLPHPPAGTNRRSTLWHGPYTPRHTDDHQRKNAA